MTAYLHDRLNRKKYGFISKILLLVAVSSLMSCGGAKSAQELESFEKLKNLVYNQPFEIENDWADPLRWNMVNLIGNPNHIRFSKDSVDIFLPYFGERQIGGGYGDRRGGIIYQGEPEELSIEENEKKQRIVLKFNGRQDNEILSFIITLYPDGNAHTSVNSSQRDAISYRGDFKVLPEKEKQQVDLLLDRKN